MTHYLLSAETMFSAAHTLPGVDTCEQLHGHNWRVRVTVRMAEDDLDDNGMGVDFRVLEQITGESVADFEHRHLNELEPFATRPPTAERIARIVAERVTARLTELPASAAVDEVTLWEMPQYRVVYRP